MRLITSIGRDFSRGAVAAVLFLAVACGSGTGAASASPSSQPSGSASSDSSMHHVALDVLSSRFGQVVVDGQGRAIYLFAADKTSDSTCYDACATAWPPVLADKGAKVDAMHGTTASLTGTTTRRDGTVQVTYNGHPLYYFEGDKKPGEINCQGVVNFGAAWYVVDPNGNAITKS
jgi:predicted lipoprotein with Yx(FWY)xxD motif